MSLEDFYITMPNLRAPHLEETQVIDADRTQAIWDNSVRRHRRDDPPWAVAFSVLGGILLLASGTFFFALGMMM